MADQPVKLTTEELIEFLKANDLTEEEFYNTVTADIFDFTAPGQVERAQGTVRYFRYKICELLLPVIRQLRAQQGGPRGE